MRQIAGIERLLLAFAAVLFAATLFVSWRSPLFTDEIATKIAMARSHLDGGHHISWIPECKTEFEQPVPLAGKPIYALESALYHDHSDLALFRTMGMLSFILWLAYLCYAANRLAQRRGWDWRGASAVLPWVTLGVLPVLFGFERPEQPVLWGVLFVSTTPLLAPRRAPNALLLAYVFLCLLGSFHHYSSALYAPAWIVAAFALWPDARRRAIAVATTLYATGVALAAAYFKSLCPEVPRVASIRQGSTLGPGELLTNPATFVSHALESLLRVPFSLIHVTFQPDYQAYWLPSTPVPHVEGTTNWWPGASVDGTELAVNWLIALTAAAALALIAWATVRRARDAWRRGARADQRFRARMALALLLGFVTACAHQKVKKFYHFQLHVPVLICAGLLVLDGAAFGRRARQALRACAPALLLVSCISQTLLLARFAPNAFGSWTTPGTPAGQAYSVNHVGYEEAARRIRDAAKLCGIADGPQTRHLVVDDTTYATLSHTYEPYLLWYLVSRGGEKDFKSFMRDYGSDGLIVDCLHLNRADREAALSAEGYCCMKTR